MRAPARSPRARGGRSASRFTSSRTNAPPARWRSWSRKSGARSCTRSATTLVWRRTTFRIRGGPSLLMESPKRAVRKDEWFASARRRGLHLSDTDVVVAGRMYLQQPALQGRGAILDERDPVCAWTVRKRHPVRVDRRRAAGKPVGDELL